MGNNANNGNGGNGHARACARAMQLRYVADSEPGIRRLRAGAGFVYRKPDGKALRAPAELQRIKALAIPPAWKDVWICATHNGHLQAVGRDERGRKQYRYHARWRAIRDETKYDRVLAFAQALPLLRARIAQDLAKPGHPRDKVLALVAHLLEETLIRVGNEEYSRLNGSFGLTTLRDHHVEIDGAQVSFAFRGKSGVVHQIRVTDRRLARIVKHCQDLPGQELFQYVDEAGRCRRVSSGDINDYLRQATGQDFTAKDFRTWAGTVLAAQLLHQQPAAQAVREAKRQVVQAIAQVAQRLGNTPTICRNCYVHPAVINGYLDGTLHAAFRRRQRLLRATVEGLKPEERIVLRFLQPGRRNAVSGNRG